MSPDFSPRQEQDPPLPVAKRPSAQFLELATNFSIAVRDEIRINDLPPTEAFEKVRLEYIAKRAVSGIGLIAICAAAPVSVIMLGSAALPLEAVLLSVASAAFGIHYGKKIWSLYQDSQDVIRCFQECGKDRARFSYFIASTRNHLGLNPPRHNNFNDMD